MSYRCGLDSISSKLMYEKHNLLTIIIFMIFSGKSNIATAQHIQYAKQQAYVVAVLHCM